MKPSLTAGDFGQLRAFAAVAEALSFVRAAERLGVTSQALSQTIRALEERIGTRLFNRTTRSVSLTETGNAMFLQIAPAMEGLADAIGRARSRRGRVSGTVRLHSFRLAANLYIAPCLEILNREWPDVVLDLTLDDRVVDLVAERFDASLRVGETIERDMVAVQVGPELRQLAVASPTYLARHGEPKNPRDLAHHRCISWRWPGYEQPYRWEFQQGGRWFDVAVTGPFIVNSRDFAVEAALTGLGIAFAVEQSVCDHLAAGRLVALLQEWSPPFAGFYLCYPSDQLMAAPLRAVVDAIVAASMPST